MSGRTQQHLEGVVHYLVAVVHNDLQRGSLLPSFLPWLCADFLWILAKGGDVPPESLP